MVKISNLKTHDRFLTIVASSILFLFFLFVLWLLQLGVFYSILVAVIYFIPIYYITRIIAFTWDVFVTEEGVLLQNIRKREVKISFTGLHVGDCGFLSELYNVYKIQHEGAEYLFIYKPKGSLFKGTSWGISHNVPSEIIEKITIEHSKIYSP